MKKLFEKFILTEIGLIRICIILSIIGFSSDLIGNYDAYNEKLILPIERYDQIQDIESITENSSILLDKKLLISSLNLFYNYVFETEAGVSFLNTTTILICLFCTLKFTWNIDINEFFKKDVYKLIQLIAKTLLLYFFISQFSFNQLRSNLSEHGLVPEPYTLVNPLSWTILITIVCIGWFARIMRSGYTLQQEQDLTV